LTTEEYYVANKLAKGFIGTNNFDTNSRLCMASAVAGYKTSLGADAARPSQGRGPASQCHRKDRGSLCRPRHHDRDPYSQR
jgi:assimilatory nitrate reductase catalytic subunit